MVDGPEPLASCPFPSLQSVVSSRARPSEEPPPGPPPGPHQRRAAGPCTGCGKGQAWRSREPLKPSLRRLQAINCADRGDLKCQGPGGPSDKPQRKRRGAEPDVREGSAVRLTPSLGQAGRCVPPVASAPAHGAPSALSRLSKDTHNSENYPPALRDDTITDRSESNSVSPKLHGQGPAPATLDSL